METASKQPEDTSRGETAPRPRNPVRRLYDWVLTWADSRWGGVALFTLAFAESSFFPVPPDVLLIALAIGSRKKAFRYAALCTVGSVLGGVAGYGLGWAAAPLGKSILIALASEDFYYTVAARYGENAFAAIVVAGFTPIPYKVFTVTAGIFSDFVPLSTLVVGSLISRTARFFLVAGLIYIFGRPVKAFIDRYFNILSLVFAILLVGGFYIAASRGGGGGHPGQRLPVLVKELSLPDVELRTRAHEALQRAARSLDGEPGFGYDPKREPGENREAIARWKAWASKAAERLKASRAKDP